jgi:hypothetical protein
VEEGPAAQAEWTTYRGFHLLFNTKGEPYLTKQNESASFVENGTGSSWEGDRNGWWVGMNYGWMMLLGLWLAFRTLKPPTTRAESLFQRGHQGQLTIAACAGFLPLMLVFGQALWGYWVLLLGLACLILSPFLWREAPSIHQATEPDLKTAKSEPAVGGSAVGTALLSVFTWVLTIFYLLPVLVLFFDRTFFELKMPAGQIVWWLLLCLPGVALALFNLQLANAVEMERDSRKDGRISRQWGLHWCLSIGSLLVPLALLIVFFSL